MAVYRGAGSCNTKLLAWICNDFRGRIVKVLTIYPNIYLPYFQGPTRRYTVRAVFVLFYAIFPYH